MPRRCRARHSELFVFKESNAALFEDAKPFPSIVAIKLKRVFPKFDAAIFSGSISASAAFQVRALLQRCLTV